MRPSENRQDVVNTRLVEGIQEIDLDRERRVKAIQIDAGREVPDCPGSDPVRVETAAERRAFLSRLRDALSQG